MLNLLHPFAMTWHFFAITLLLFITAAVAVACMQAAWFRRSTPGARPFAWMMLAAAIWAIGSAFEFATDTYALKIFWSKFQYLGVSTLAVFWFLFTVEYSQVYPRLSLHNRRAMIGLSIIPAATILAVFTNEWHGWIWPQVSIVQTTPQLFVEYHHGPGFWLIAAYSYIFLLLGTITLGWNLARFPNTYRRQALSLLVGVLIPWVANFTYMAGIRLLPGIDPTPIAFALTGVIYVREVFRFHLFDLVPVAQDSVIESMGDGVVVIDEHERIVYINHSGQLMLDGAKTGQALGKTCASGWPELLSVVRQPDFPPEKPHTGPSARSLPVQIRLDGPRPRFLEAQVDPLERTRSGSGGRLILLRDVTERRSSDELLRQQSVALAAAPNSIMITDRQGTIQWVNPAFTRMTGYNLEDVQGKNPRILNSGTQDREFYRQLWETILAGKNWEGELVNRRKDGQIYVEEATIAPVLNAQGEITHFIAIKQDVTARRELEKARDDLIQAIVHDLRNPINNVLFSLEMIERLPIIDQIPPEILSMIGISRENSWRMLGMINSMLDLSRLESGSQPLLIEPVVLAELVEQTIHAQAILAQHREVLILNDVPYDLPAIAVDRALIGRVLQNLLDNAVKFTDQGSNIEINARYEAAARRVIVSVHDNGPGIPPDLHSSLFQKFSTGATPQRGSGLGLAFCRRAIDAHNGKIWVESAENQGTTFLFSLPVMESAGQAAKINAGAMNR